MTVQIKDIDKKYYRDYLQVNLPEKIIDMHTHIWLREFINEDVSKPRGQKWPTLVASQNSIDELKKTYSLMFPNKEVTPLIFGWPETDVNLDATNNYSCDVSKQHHLPALIVTTPEWDQEEIEKRVAKGKFIGLKPYLSWAPKNISSNEITVYDFLPKAQLDVANKNGWIVLLHIPRSKRLKDPVNLQHLLEIEEKYPNVKLIVAHIGRAYCLEDIGNAMEVLKRTQRMVFDFSGNTNAVVMQKALETFGPKRLIFGSDLPIVRMRMRRICENGTYINLVPPGIYGNISNDPHMREVDAEEAETLSFFMYETIGAMLKAVSNLKLSMLDIHDIFFNNAKNLLESVGWNI